ncbi:MAG: hypothetical protein AAB973_04200, partial [Patescibacteria group bacterium]
LYHGVSIYYIGIREGSGSTSATYISNWNDCYYGGDGNGVQTTKLISDSGGSSGSCPASGYSSAWSAYGAGYQYPQLCQGVASIASLLGLTGAAAVKTYCETIEAAASVTEADYASFSNWRFRDPNDL